MLNKKQKNYFPNVYLDEHAAFMRPSFSPMRTIEISKTKLRGKDERSFISTTLYQTNGILVTSDREFVEELPDNTHIKHAGVVYVPKEMEMGEKLYFGEIVCTYIMAGCKKTSKFIWRNTILYPGYDGLRSLHKGKDVLEFSWEWLAQT